MIWKDLRNFFHEGFVETGTIVLLAQHIQNMLNSSYSPVPRSTGYTHPPPPPQGIYQTQETQILKHHATAIASKI